MNYMNIIFSVAFILIPILGMAMFAVQERITWTLYEEFNAIWVRLGSPGGFLWSPPGRAAVDNLRRTRAFWLGNLFPLLRREGRFPRKIIRLYIISYCLAIGGVLYMASLFYFIYNYYIKVPS